MLPPPLQTILSLDGFILFIEGPKGFGKTNIAMLLAELCHEHKLRENIATNIETECYYVTKIDNYPDLKYWLEHTEGKKLYVLDEAGKHIKRMRFMTEQNLKFMELIQLIRHYDAGFIGIAPSSKFIDTAFLNTDILDARIRKLSLKRAIVHDYRNNDHYFLTDLPKTSIDHDSKDIANFSMEKVISISDLSVGGQIAKYILMGWKRNAIQNALKLHPQTYKREYNEFLAQSLKSQFTPIQEVKKPIETSIKP